MVSILNLANWHDDSEFAGDELSMTISSNPPLSGLICADKNITFTCHVLNETPLQYQWSIDGDKPKIGDKTYTMRSPSRLFVVTCEVYARQSTAAIQYGSTNVTVQPNSKQI